MQMMYNMVHGQGIQSAQYECRELRHASVEQDAILSNTYLAEKKKKKKELSFLVIKK